MIDIRQALADQIEELQDQEEALELKHAELQEVLQRRMIAELFEQVERPLLALQEQIRRLKAALLALDGKSAASEEQDQRGKSHLSAEHQAAVSSVISLSQKIRRSEQELHGLPAEVRTQVESEIATWKSQLVEAREKLKSFKKKRKA